MRMVAKYYTSEQKEEAYGCLSLPDTVLYQFLHSSPSSVQDKLPGFKVYDLNGNNFYHIQIEIIFIMKECISLYLVFKAITWGFINLQTRVMNFTKEKDFGV